MPTRLIIGGDSKVGQALHGRYHAEGLPVIATSRRSEQTSHVSLDLAEDPARWRLPDDVGVVFLCAAVTRLETCRTQPDASAKVNVHAPLHLARTLHARGAFIVFLSTNQVFDGTKPYRRVDEPVCPQSEYGRQKAELERRLLELGAGVAVVRFTKILEPHVPLFEQWKTELRQGHVIEPFSDMVQAPVPLAFAVRSLASVAEERRSGFFHVSGERDMSYAEMGLAAAHAVGAKPSLVRPKRAVDSGIAPENLPKHTTLCTRSLDRLGLRAPEVERTVREALTGVCSAAA
ncbi:MAG: sugar nucleotide-binding protein [Gemmataceae bacterium]